MTPNTNPTQAQVPQPHARDRLSTEPTYPIWPQYAELLPLDSFRDHPAVDSVHIPRDRDTHRWGPLSIQLRLTSSPSSLPTDDPDRPPIATIAQELTTIAETPDIPGTTVEVSPCSTRTGADSNTQVLTPTGTHEYDLVCNYWMHPCTRYADAALAESDIIRSFHLSWAPTADDLSQRSYEWENTTPLTLSVGWSCLPERVSLATHIKSTLSCALTARLPRRTYVTVDADTVSERSLQEDSPPSLDHGNPQTLPDLSTGTSSHQSSPPSDSSSTYARGRFSIAFSSRDTQQHPQSAIYNAPAQALSECLPPAGTDDSSTQTTLSTTTEPSHDDTQRAADRAWPRPSPDTPPAHQRSGTQHRDSSVPADIQLTVTSPPYLDLIDYSAVGAGHWDQAQSQSQSHDLDGWLTTQRDIFRTVFDHTRDGGFCAVVISPIKDNSGSPSLSLLPQRFAVLMEDIGWHLHHSLTWNKTTSRDGSFGTTIQHPMPTYYHPNSQTERIQVWRKGPVVNRPDEDSRFPLTEVVKKEMANDVWHIPPESFTRTDLFHPCPFPAELVYRLVQFYAPKGTLVCDPMCGSGTTPQVADRMGRIGLGLELNPSFIGNARDRLASRTYSRETTIIPQYDTRTVPHGSSASQSSDSPLNTSTSSHNASPADRTDRTQQVLTQFDSNTTK
jgi:site-specific DNA-methyltransferase (adenine-specific)